MSDQVLLARSRLSVERPYYALQLWSVAFLPKSDFRALTGAPIGVSKDWRCYYDREWIAANWSMEETMVVLEHELGHLLRLHSERAEVAGIPSTPWRKCKTRKEWRRLVVVEKQSLHQRWNIAADAEINDDLKGLPGKCVYPKELRLPEGKSAEFYYQHMPKQHSGGQGSGSSSDGVSRPWEDPSDPGGIQVKAKRNALVKQTMEAIVKSRGNVPAGLERYAQEALRPPVIPWDSLLVAALRNACLTVRGRSDFTYRFPSRRQWLGRKLGVVFPSMAEHLPRVGFLQDTSGSMGDEDLAEGLARMAEVLQSTKIQSLTVLSCDCEVSWIREIVSTFSVKLSGGGGTDMRVGIDEAARLKPRLDVLVVFTDGGTPWPAKPSPFKLINVYSRGGSVTGPSWAVNIQMEARQ
jgi:predicted metal-dependent peptidase